MKLKTYFFIFTAVILFGTLFIFSKQVITPFGPLNSFSYLFMRSSFGSIFMFSLLLCKRLLGELVDNFKQYFKDILIMTSCFHLLPLIIVFLATPHTSASNQVIINNLNLACVVIINFLLFGKVPTRNLIISVILNFFGILLVLMPLNLQTNQTLIGDLLMIVAVVIGAFFPIWNKRLAKVTNPLILGFYLNTIPAIILFPFVFILNLAPSYTQLNLTQWFYMIWIGVGVSGIAYTLGNAAYKDKDLTPELYSTFTTLIPVIGLGLSLLIFKEHLEWYNLVGSAIVILSIYLAQRTKPDKSSGKTSES
ncbi:MAG: DMT family transporter [Promethearchaeota archaeon]